jgi:hypothetical protein
MAVTKHPRVCQTGQTLTVMVCEFKRDGARHWERGIVINEGREDRSIIDMTGTPVKAPLADWHEATWDGCLVVRG